MYEYLIDLAVPWLPINGLAGCPSCSCPGHPLHHSGPQPPWIVLRRTHGRNHRRIFHPSHRYKRYPGPSYSRRWYFSTRVSMHRQPMGLRLNSGMDNTDSPQAKPIYSPGSLLHIREGAFLYLKKYFQLKQL